MNKNTIYYKNNQLNKPKTLVHLLMYWVGCVLSGRKYVKVVTQSGNSLDAF